MQNKVELKTGPIVAIGGGELKDLETLQIDKEIKKLTRKSHPKALFIGTASNDSTGYFETFKSVYGKKLGCIVDKLSLISKKYSQSEIEKKILSADLIYVGGGNTLRMLQIWKKNEVDKLLRKAYEKGIVLSGLSAGAICWFKYGLSDSKKFSKEGKRKFNFIRVKGLGFLPFTISPHHIREKNKRNPALNTLIEKNKGVGLAIDDNTALIVEGNSYRVISSKIESRVRKVILYKGKIQKTVIIDKGSLDSLTNKNVRL